MLHEELTDQQLISEVATHVMGWKMEEGSWFDMKRPENHWWVSDCRDWNPLTDWNHWREVEEKLMERTSVFWRFVDEILKIGNRGPNYYPPEFNSDLRTRCLAALAAVSPQTNAQ